MGAGEDRPARLVYSIHGNFLIHRIRSCGEMWGLVGKASFKKRAKRILRSPRLLLITGILTVLTTTLLFANKGLWRHIELQHQIAERQATLAKLQSDEENVSRNVALLKLEDASTIERIARERYGMKRPGETIYQSEP